MKMSQESVFVNMQEFAFKAKERLPIVSGYSQLNWLLSFCAWLQIKILNVTAPFLENNII